MINCRQLVLMGKPCKLCTSSNHTVNKQQQHIKADFANCPFFKDTFQAILTNKQERQLISLNSFTTTTLVCFARNFTSNTDCHQGQGCRECRYVTEAPLFIHTFYLGLNLIVLICMFVHVNFYQNCYCP